MTLTPQDLARILALAEKATPGTRYAIPHFTPHSGFWIKGPLKGEPEDRAHIASVGDEDDADFIAACSPDVIRALVRMAQGGEG